MENSPCFPRKEDCTMAKKRVIVQLNLKPDADPDLVKKFVKWMIEQWIPAEREAPGLLSIELVERQRDPVPHQPNNRASDFALIELWESAEANHRWWAGNQTERLREALKVARDLQQPIAGESLDCHYTVIE